MLAKIISRLTIKKRYNLAKNMNLYLNYLIELKKSKKKFIISTINKMSK